MKTHFSADMQRARWQAHILNDALRRKGVKLTPRAALDIVSLMHGWESWRAWEQEQTWERCLDRGVDGHHKSKSRELVRQTFKIE